MTNEFHEIISGVNNIKFEKITRVAKIKSPLEGFNLVSQKIEYRKDPLLNHWSRLNALRAERVKQASAPGENFQDNLNQLIENSAKKCFFCPNNIPNSTPKFPKELGLGERITKDDFSLFPNLFVFSEYHAVGVLGTEHFKPIDKIPAKTWKNALLGSIEYFKAITKYDPQVKYPSINFNFLPTSASSIIHPHIQLIQDILPTKLTGELLKESLKYFQESGKQWNYWVDLIESEKKLQERFIAESKSMAWIATFSPIGKNELTGICKLPKTDITTFNDKEVEMFSMEIEKALKALVKGRGASAVNMAIFLGPMHEDHSKEFRISIKIVTRPTLLPNYTADVGFMEMLHQETVGEATPENIAESVREYF
ncbi:MAG: hypothetical protein ACFFDW_05830 [Candidatus Thorarchaeota archaeon]